MLLGSALFCFKFFFQEGHRLSPVGGVGGRQTSFLAPKQGQSRELAWAVETIGGGSNAFTIQHITRTRFIILQLQLQFNTTTPPLPLPLPSTENVDSFKIFSCCQLCTLVQREVELQPVSASRLFLAVTDLSSHKL